MTLQMQDFEAAYAAAFMAQAKKDSGRIKAISDRNGNGAGRPRNVGPGQAGKRALVALTKSGPTTAEAISSALGVSRHRARAILLDLTRSGYVVRRERSSETEPYFYEVAP